MIKFAIGLVCGALLAAVAAQAQVSFSPEQNYVLTLALAACKDSVK